MNFFRRRARRTTITISDQTRSSRASLSSAEGKTSQLGSTGTLRKTVVNDFKEENYHKSPTVQFEEHSSLKSSAKLLKKKIKHAHFSDDTNDNNNVGSAISQNSPGIPYTDNADDNRLTNEPRDMTLLARPGPSLVRETISEATGTPMSLYASVIKGDKTELKKIISGNPELLDTPDNFGRTPLMYCVLADRLDCAKFLIKMGCKLDQVDNAGRSAIHSAAHKGSYTFLELLHNRGARIDIKDHDGQTALHLATRIRTGKCLEFLLRNVGPGMVDVPDNQMRTALHWGAAFNNTECVKLLIKYGINIAIPDSAGKTPLHWAANNHDPSAVNTMAALLEKSPGVVNWQDYEGRTALHFAVADGNSAAVELLVKFKQLEYFEPYTCDVDRSDNTFRTALHWAAQLGHTHIVKLLLDANAKNSSSDAYGATPFLYAALNNNHCVVEAMIAHDPNIVEQVDIEGRNALMWAAGKGANDVIRAVLGIRKNVQNKDAENQAVENRQDHKPAGSRDEDVSSRLGFTPVDINKTDNKENTALHVAAWNGHGSSVELLLSHGARHDLQNHMNHTPIFGACEKGHLNVVKYLLDYSASITLVDSECRSPLHWAALGGHAEVCELLIKEGLDVDVRDTLDRTPLHCAAFGGFINCMNLLLENGANVDLQDQEGRSALHWAAQSGHLDATKLLFQYAVFPNPMEYTEERLTPLNHALQKEREEVAQYLIEQGALSAEHIRNIAATKMQACFRGYQVRKTFPMQKKLLMKMQMLRNKCKKDRTTRSKKRSEGQMSDDGRKNEQLLSPLSSQPDVLPNASFTSDTTEDDEQKLDNAVQTDENIIIPTMTENSTLLETRSASEMISTPDRKEENQAELPEEKIGSVIVPDPLVPVSGPSLSHDEGIISDHMSVASSSHSSLRSDGKGKKDLSANESTNAPVADSMSEDKSLLAQLVSEEKDGTKENSDSKSEAGVIQSTPSAEYKDSRKEGRRKKVKKNRVKKDEGRKTTDSDSPKDTCSVAKASPSSSPMSLRSTASTSNQFADSNPNPLNPVPPPNPRSRNKRTKRKTKSPSVTQYPRQRDYPALDTIGNEDNIQGETVSGLAYKCPPPQKSFFDEVLPNLSPPPITAFSSSLQLSEYIESLMKLSRKEQKSLKDHQKKRSDAFRAAINAANTIQKAWWRYLWLKRPEVRRKFRNARRKNHRVERARKKEKITVEALEDEPSEDTKNNSNGSIPTNQKARKAKSHQRRKLLPDIKSNSSSSVFEERSPRSDNSASPSEVQPLNNAGKRVKRPKTVGPSQNSVYISVEKLEELSRIYGRPQVVRELLNANTKTSLPSIDRSTRSSGSKLRPVTVTEIKTPNSDASVGYAQNQKNPASSKSSPRHWAGASDSQRQSGMPETLISKPHPRSKSGPMTQHYHQKSNLNQDIDVSRLPLQWQKLYGELQNMEVADSKRRNATRFSYNLGDMSL